MTSFTSLLSSLGSGQPSAPQPKQPSSNLTSIDAVVSRQQNQALVENIRSTPNNAVAGIKRKAEDQATSGSAKVIKTEYNVPVRTPGQSNTPTTAKSGPLTAGSIAPYRGTARASGVTTPSAAASRPVPKPATTTPASTNATSTATNGTAKPKRGFASLMEKAKAAQEVAKAVGSSTIKHKPVERLTKRDRRKMQEEALRQKANLKTGKSASVPAPDRSKGGMPVNHKPAMQKTTQEPAYKGTMRKPVERQESTYKGTMNRPGQGTSSGKPAVKKNLAKDKYGGYASWSDLDEADEDGEDGYDESDASSDMMDAGFDDMEAEERRALQAAKKEDQEALEEEERHRQLKLDRKKKLLALSKNAAAKKKY